MQSEVKNSKTENKRFDYKWVIIGICFMMIFICLGFCSSTKSLYIAPVTEYLGIKRSTYSLNESFRYVSTAIINIFFGSLVAKFGTKKLILAGFISLIISNIIYASANHLVMFYVGGIFLGIGLSWTTTTMIGCVVNRWCSENKGTIMGAILAANGLGGALATQIVTPVIYKSAVGYKNAYLLTAGILLLLGTLIAVFYKERPLLENLHDTGHKKKGRGQSWSGIAYSDAVKKSYFYSACVCIFLTGFVLQGTTGISAAHLKDIGIDAGVIGVLMSVHSLSLAVFKFLAGFMYDRFGLKTTVNICSITAIVVLLLLCMVTNSVVGLILAAIYVIFSSVALPLETIMLPIYANDLFGEKSFNKMLGIFVSVNTVGYALGAPLVNLCYDILGSYRLAFILCAGLMILVVVLLQFVINTARQEKEKVLKSEVE